MSGGKSYLNAEYMAYAERRKDSSDLHRRIYNQLQRNNVGAIIRSGDTVYVEGYRTPTYIVDNIKSWVKTQGLRYLRC